jgi:hypothetical protein
MLSMLCSAGMFADPIYAKRGSSLMGKARVRLALSMGVLTVLCLGLTLRTSVARHMEVLSPTEAKELAGGTMNDYKCAISTACNSANKCGGRSYTDCTNGPNQYTQTRVPYTCAPDPDNGNWCTLNARKDCNTIFTCQWYPLQDSCGSGSPLPPFTQRPDACDDKDGHHTCGS